MSETSSPVPALLRAARRTYAVAVLNALAEAGFEDIPRNGSYVLGAMAGSGVPLGSIITELGVSKQAAGQLVDALVVRGYLDRSVDPSDRRRLTLALTERGSDAATEVHAAVARVDAELERRVGHERLADLRATLYALCELAEPDPTRVP